MKYVLIALVILMACKNIGSKSSSDSVVSVDSNNDNSTNIIGDSERACSLCSSKQYLEENYNVELYINCTDYCGLEEGEDTPEKQQCDLDCIADRLLLAKDDCLVERGCESDEVVDQEVVASEE